MRLMVLMISWRTSWDSCSNCSSDKGWMSEGPLMESRSRVISFLRGECEENNEQISLPVPAVHCQLNRPPYTIYAPLPNFGADNVPPGPPRPKASLKRQPPGVPTIQ